MATDINAFDAIASSQALIAEAMVIGMLDASVIEPTTSIGARAIEYAVRGWPVFPLWGKHPAIKGGHGLLDATTDIDQIAAWWGGRYIRANIGGRVPGSMVVIDIDPYHGGLESLAALEKQYGPLPATLTDLSGRGDGGAHYFFRRPVGKLTAKDLGRGVDLKTSSGYVVLPPSIHPDTGKRYRRIEAPVAAPPDWLVKLLRASAPLTHATKAASSFKCAGRQWQKFSGSIADDFCAHTSWAEILEPYGWSCLDTDPDADGARWRHPTATATYSATIKFGLLFVYSSNTAFDVTESGNAHGYSCFKAYAVLNHGGDMSAAARALGNAMG
jgi:hypothetical protein